MRRSGMILTLMVSILALLGLGLGSLRAAPLGGTPEPAAYLPAVIVDVTPVPPPAGWLDYLNLFRAEVGAVPLVENGAWSSGGVLHGRYMVKNDVITHAEDPANPWYTPEGDAAGRNGNVMVSSWEDAPETLAIDYWITGPFHAVGILDPKLHTTGYGIYREGDGGWEYGATLDVLRGRGSLPPGTTFPLFFPGDGGQTWLTEYPGGEWPDPLTACPGYSTPSGPPLIIQLGSGGVTPSVTATEVRRNGTPVEHCWFDETNYVNGDGSAQSTGRSVLNSRDAVVIMPRSPLQQGATYQVSVTANGATHTWSFAVVNHPLAPAAPAPDHTHRMATLPME